MGEENGRAQESPATAQPPPAGLSAFEFFLNSGTEELAWEVRMLRPGPQALELLRGLVLCGLVYTLSMGPLTGEERWAKKS